MCGLDDVQRGKYFGGKLIRTEVEVRVGKPKNRKAVGNDEVNGEMVMGGELDLEAGNMAFKSCVVPKDWIPAVIVNVKIIEPLAC